MLTITLEPNRQTVPFATGTTKRYERTGDKVVHIQRKLRCQRGKVSVISVTQLPLTTRPWPAGSKRDWMISRGILTPFLVDSSPQCKLEAKWEDAIEAKLLQEHPGVLLMDYKSYNAAIAESQEVTNA